jgi:hypothetical protein
LDGNYHFGFFTIRLIQSNALTWMIAFNLGPALSMP